MKIFITGSSGYVGYVLSKYFSEKGIKVVGTDIIQNPVWKGNKNFIFYHCDIRNKQKLKEILEKEKPTRIIHLAFLMTPLHNLKKEHAIDVAGSKNILDLADKMNSVQQLIEFSSTSAYGAWPNNRLWIEEEQPLRPRDYRYGINKKKVEEYYNKFPARKDLKIVIVRMCTAIGPLYHKKGGVVSLLVKAPFLAKVNNHYCELQFLHEDDLTYLIELILKDKEINGIYNLVPDSYATIKQLASKKMFIPLPLWLMRGIVSILWILRFSSMKPAEITLSTYGIIASPQKLMKKYNYKFKYSTLEGFRDTVRKRKEKGTL